MKTSTIMGPHGGPLVACGAGLVELSVFESGVPPRFRLYFFDAERAPIPPSGEPVVLETIRTGKQRQSFGFRREADYLEATTNLPEPHEFDVSLSVGRDTCQTTFTEEAHGHGGGGHGHTHGIVDPMVDTTAKGMRAVKWSFVMLFVTASIQLVVVLMSGSVALLADMIHNYGDAATAIPLSIAFTLARRSPTRRFTYGFGRVEDLAGLAVVLTILTSAIIAGYVAIERLLHPQAVDHLGVVIVASVVGFIGNEAVAIFRIRVGKEIGSAALVADGYHARTDGWTSLAVLVGAIGVHVGYAKADPIVGLVITAAILVVVWQSVKQVFSRMLDGVEPEVIDQIRTASAAVAGVVGVTDVRARWLGHRLRAEVNITVAPELSVAAAHEIAKTLEHDLIHHLRFLSAAVIHLDPASHAGEARHVRGPHEHDGLAEHAH